MASIASRKAAWAQQGLVWQDIADATEKGVEAALQEIGIVVHRMIVTKLSEPGSGETYTRGGVSHTASAPGDPPAVDTGQYRASWSWEVNSGSKTVSIGTDQVRGPALEFGSSTMEARPHIRPVMEEVSVRTPGHQSIQSIVERRIGDAQDGVKAEAFTLNLAVRA